MAGPFTRDDFEKLVPADKKLSAEWVKSLFERGTRTAYRWPESEKIGLPVGGICAGQLYLGGDGRLWHWDIFNQILSTGAEHYAHPLKPTSPVDQGFALKFTTGGASQVRALDHTGWNEVTFQGEYPIGLVEYRDAAAPVRVSLEAYSPFIPLNPEDSALPATILRFTVQNVSAAPVQAELAGWLQNAACLHSASSHLGHRRNQVFRREPTPARTGFTFLECSAEAAPAVARSTPRPDIVFDDFEQEQYQGWTATGTAFGLGPVSKSQIPIYQGPLGLNGQRTVNSHAAAPGSEVVARDAATGTLTSPAFVIERDYVTFLIGGGAHRGRTCLNLLVDGQVRLSATGKNENRMQPQTFDVRLWAGKKAQLQIVDNEKGAWGNIGIDHIVFSDQPKSPLRPLREQPDFGTMGLALVRTDPTGPDLPKPQDLARSELLGESPLAALFSEMPTPSDAPITRPFGPKLVGSLMRRMTLGPGESATVTFVLTWHFPNVQLSGLGQHEGRSYGKAFGSALAVAEYIATHWDRLSRQTRLWHDTWYDSTLPYWFLDRTFLNTSILATNTCYWLGNGRFYAWEGVGCCAGTCTHVWHYAHAAARLFPSLERSLRERVDYGIGLDAATGRIRFRAEHNDHWAVDGQAGVILRTLREHQMSPDAAFLRRIWPRVKTALTFLINKDTEGDGIIDGPQHNTLDADWFGEVAWLSGLYLAALRAGEEMARELGDDAFASRCRALFDRGRPRIVERLFNGEYFANRVDLQHRDAINSGTGCEIDQAFGQSWAFQVGLGRVLPEKETRSALQALWRYNFSPDVGPYRQAYKPGRWYAMAGEAGLLMCTFPRSDWDYPQAAGKGPDWAAGYFNECMNGFEYQVAGHALWEGLLTEGLAITRAVHDRYHAARRNPWNEVECGDHYARSMASYGVYLAACGYEHHGPKGRLGFAPRLTPGDFRAAFTAAEGWGTFTQKTEQPVTRCSVQVRWGTLRLRTLALAPGGNASPIKASVTLRGQMIEATVSVQGGKTEIQLREETVIREGETLEVELT